MYVSLSEARARLTDLVRQAEAGEEVVLTRHGRPAARIIAMAPAPTGEAGTRLIERLRAVRSPQGQGLELPGFDIHWRHWPAHLPRLHISALEEAFTSSGPECSRSAPWTG